MARPSRIEFAGAWYHVMNRGAQKRPTYRSRSDRLLFLDVVADAVNEHRIEIHAYALMDNHFHLLVRTPEPNLGQAMRDIGGFYTQRFNSRHEIDGALFRGRYKAVLVDADSYLLNASRYIHRNPVDAGLVPTASASEWTSYPSYLGRVPKPGWLTVDETLNIAGSRPAYEAFVEQTSDPILDRFYRRDRLPAVLGSDDFRQQIERDFSSRFQPNDNLIFDRVETAIGSSVAKRASSRTASNSDIRLLGALLASELGVPAEAIAAHHGYASAASASSAIHRFRQTIQTNPALADLTHAVRSLLAERQEDGRDQDQAA